MGKLGSRWQRFNENLMRAFSPIEPAKESAKRRFARLFGASIVIFFVALGVRICHWQDRPILVGEEFDGLVKGYQYEAQQILDSKRLLFPAGAVDRSDASALVHPPGYPILLAGASLLLGQRQSTLIFAHLVWNALAVVLLFLLVAELLPWAVAVLAAVLAACSPQLASHSLTLLPDSLVALPILLAVYLLVRATKQPGLGKFIFAGIALGLSCWLRSNALLLGLFFTAVIFVVFRGVVIRGDVSRRYALAFLAAVLITIAPVTVRNAVVYGRFIPLSIGAGITLIEGIADYDKSGRFGMPQYDGDVKAKDAAWHNRPAYEKNLWYPDGIERDDERFARGFAVVREHPLWFLSVMARRGGAMLRYNDSQRLGWPADTALAPVVAASVPFGHRLPAADERHPLWSSSAADLLTRGSGLSDGVQRTYSQDEQTLRMTTGDAGSVEMFASETIPVRPYMDYVWKLVARVEAPPVAITASSPDRRVTVGSLWLNRPTSLRKQPGGPDWEVLELPFASGNQEEVQLVVLSNGGAGATIALGEAHLYEVGETPRLWLRPVRSLIRRVQKDWFKTERMIPLILLGILLLLLARQKRTLLILLTVPLYYLLVQSAFHTEYRYILPLHYFLFVMAATAIYVAGLAGLAGLTGLYRRFITSARRWSKPDIGSFDLSG